MTDNNDNADDPNNGPIRCPCGSKEALPHAQNLQEGQQDWVACGICNVWQHSICVGLLEDFEKNMPEKYFCEECKPEHHKRFRFDLGPDDRHRIAKQRQEMMAMPPPSDKDEIKKRMEWLVAEIEAIMQEHPQAVIVEWAKINGMQADFQAARATRQASELPPDPWTMAAFVFMVRNAIGIVLWNASVSAVEEFRTRLIKVRFSEAEAVATELWSLRSWLDDEFMEKVQEEGSRLGRSDFETVRRHFNMKEIDQGREISEWLKPVSFT